MVQSGTTSISGQHHFNRLVVLNGATLTHPQTEVGSVERIDVSADAIYVACDATIDVSGRGYTGSSSGLGRTYDNTVIGGSSVSSGGSHGGRGGRIEETAGDSAATFDSLYDPNHPGGAGAASDNNTCSPCLGGGGVVRLDAPSIVLDGRILANGRADIGGGGGAGGSVRIRTNQLSGLGDIRANGADGRGTGGGSGGGGRIAVYYRDLRISQALITATGGAHDLAERTGSAGTVYFEEQDGTGAHVADQLIIDNAGKVAFRESRLDSAGSGTVVSSTATTITLSSLVPQFIEGSWIEIVDAITGVVKGSWRITARTSNSVTVDVPAGQPLTAPAGARYRGYSRFDSVSLRNGGTLYAAELRTPSLSASSTSYLRVDAVHADGTITGVNLKVMNVIDAPNVTLTSAKVESNGVIRTGALNISQSSVLTHAPIDGTTIYSVDIDATDLIVDSTSSIDVNGRGFRSGTTLAGLTPSGPAAGGSHGGSGGGYLPFTDPPSPAYDSLFDPRLPGSGGGWTDSGAHGGGVVRIRATNVVLNGTIKANGLGNYRGAAGGAVRIEAQSLSGSAPSMPTAPA